MKQKTEHHEQCRVFNWVNYLSDLHQDEKELIYAVPNGGARSPTEAIRFKAEGVRAGIPDINVDIPKRGYNGMRVEMKKEGGTLSEDQVRKHRLLERVGFFVVTCYSAEEAIGHMRWYFERHG